jgi:hypothetical protein
MTRKIEAAGPGYRAVDPGSSIALQDRPRNPRRNQQIAAASEQEHRKLGFARSAGAITR